MSAVWFAPEEATTYARRLDAEAGSLPRAASRPPGDLPGALIGPLEALLASTDQILDGLREMSSATSDELRRAADDVLAADTADLHVR